jgi:biopolymer transport protein TolR
MQNSRVSIETWLGLFATDLLFVMLIVLLIFMTITPLRDLPVYVDVPTVSFAEISRETSDDLTISIPREDFIAFNDEIVRLADLDQRIASARRGVYTTVRIRAARNIPYGTVRRIVQWARDAGYTRVTFIVRGPAATTPESPDMAWPCPPDYWQIAIALLFAAVAFTGSIIIPMRLRKRGAKPGCVGWLLLAITAFALLVAWDGWRPSCFWWY